MTITSLTKSLCVLTTILGIACVQRANADIASGLEAHWTFNDSGDQQANDTSGMGEHATLGADSAVGADDPVWVDNGPHGSALRFDGGQYLKTPPIFTIGTGPVTYAMMVKQTNSEGYQYLISNTDDYALGYFRVGFGDGGNDGNGADAGKIRVYTTNSDTNAKTKILSAAIDTSKWFHLVVTRGKDTGPLYDAGAIYINGTRDKTFGADAYNLSRTSEPWLIGQGGGDNGGDYFNGYMDEVRIYSRSLTENDVAELYAATAPEPGTLAVLAIGSLVATARRRRRIRHA